MNRRRIRFPLWVQIGAILLPSLEFSAATLAASEPAVVVTTSQELRRAFQRRGTVVLLPGKPYSVKPPLLVRGVLDCRGATIEDASEGRRRADDPTSALIECDDSTIINGTIDCKGLVNSGIFSRGKLRALDLTIVDYRRKGKHPEWNGERTKMV